VWIRDRKCNETGDRLVDETSYRRWFCAGFAVGFVSVLAGTMLAAELLKAMATDAGPLDGTMNRALFPIPESGGTYQSCEFLSA